MSLARRFSSRVSSFNFFTSLLCFLAGTYVSRIIKWLVSNGFAEYAYRAGTAGKMDVGVSLTQAGIKYKEYVDMSRKERWIERAIGFTFGVASSFFAALIGSLLR